jgi:hypothetical protein
MLGGSLSPQHGVSSGCGWRVRPPAIGGGGGAANILNKKPWTADKGLTSILWVGRGANNPSL